MSLKVVQSLHSKYMAEYSKNPLCTLLITIVATIVVADFVFIVLTKGDWFYQLLYFKNTEVLMDFFNSVLYIMEDQYGYWEIIYPPLITVFYGLIGRFSLPYTVVTGTRDLAYDLRDCQVCMMYFLVILILSLYLIHLFYQKVLSEKIGQHHVEALFLLTLLSAPVIFAITRGNSITLCIAFCFMFILGYRSENRVIRYASYVALGCAAGIKIAPALLAILILRERKYKEFVICAVIVSVLFIAPFAFTDGNILMLLHNITSDVSESTGNALISIQDMIAGLGKYIGTDLVGPLQAVVIAIISLLSAFVVLFDRSMKHWKALVIAIGCMSLCYSTGVMYVVCYMFIPMVYFIAEERSLTKTNVISMLMFTTIMMLLPWPVIRSVMILVVMAVLIYEGFTTIIRTRTLGSSTGSENSS